MKAKRWIIVTAGTVLAAAFILIDGPLAIYEFAKREHHEAHEETAWAGEWRGDPAITSKADKITAIVLERTGCLGSCPIYVLRMERSRRAKYEGRAFVARIGHFDGEVYGFDQLAYFAAERLLDLKDAYERPITCQSTTILTVEYEGGIKRISDYADSAPIDFLIFCSAVEGVASYIEWRQAEANQALQPTPVLVTPRASARGAPSTGVADL